MVTGLLSVRNALDGAGHDVWAVNTEEEYAESAGDTTLVDRRLVPQPLTG
jgi:hypothetical protein